MGRCRRPRRARRRPAEQIALDEPWCSCAALPLKPAFAALPPWPTGLTVANSAGGHHPVQKTNTTTTHTDARGRRLSPLVPRPRALEARPLLKVQKGMALILRAVFAALSLRPSWTTVANRAGGHLNSAMRYSIRPPPVRYASLLPPLLTPSSLEARPLPKVQNEPGATLEVGRRLLRPGSTRPAVENGASGHQGRPFIAAARRPPAPPGPPARRLRTSATARLKLGLPPSARTSRPLPADCRRKGTASSLPAMWK